MRTPPLTNSTCPDHTQTAFPKLGSHSLHFGSHSQPTPLPSTDHVANRLCADRPRGNSDAGHTASHRLRFRQSHPRGCPLQEVERRVALSPILSPQSSSLSQPISERCSTSIRSCRPACSSHSPALQAPTVTRHRPLFSQPSRHRRSSQRLVQRDSCSTPSLWNWSTVRIPPPTRSPHTG